MGSGGGEKYEIGGGGVVREKKVTRISFAGIDRELESKRGHS